MKTVRLHVWISGRVQGVFFRESLRSEAARLRIGGWVRNLSDGRVEAVIEGPEPAVQTLLSWCRHGPEAADVTKVESSQEVATGEDRVFRVVP